MEIEKQIKVIIYKSWNMITCIVLNINTNIIEYLSKNHKDWIRYEIQKREL